MYFIIQRRLRRRPRQRYPHAAGALSIPASVSQQLAASAAAAAEAASAVAVAAVAQRSRGGGGNNNNNSSVVVVVDFACDIGSWPNLRLLSAGPELRACRELKYFVLVYPEPRQQQQR